MASLVRRIWVIRPSLRTVYVVRSNANSINSGTEKTEVEDKATEDGPVDPYLPPWPDGVNPHTGEIGGPRGPEPTRYGDWERKGRVSDF